VRKYHERGSGEARRKRASRKRAGRKKAELET
jgi:hypothetical protein